MITPSSKTSSMFRLLTLLLVVVASEAAHGPFGSSLHNKNNKNNSNRNRYKFSSLKTIYPRAQVDHRQLQTDEEICESILSSVVDASYAPYCSCERVEDTYVLDCIASDCPDCEILLDEGGASLEEQTCALSNDGVILAAYEGGSDIYYSCIIYVSGAFDNVVCLIEDGAGSCIITVDDEPCNSCSYTDCDAGYTDLSMDCSNILPDNDWETCTDNIPETTPLVSYGNNDLFFFEGCAVGTPSTSPGAAEMTVIPTSSAGPPGDEPESAPALAPSSAPPSKSAAPSVSVAPSTSPSSRPTRARLNVNILNPTTIDRFGFLIPVPSHSPSKVPSGAPSSVPTIIAGEDNIIDATDADSRKISGGSRLSPLITLVVAAGIPFIFASW
jgi:hypothetical protein